MTAADTARLLLLGAMWGASYLFLRLGAGEFGALPLAALRAALAGLPMLAWLAASGQLDALRRHWKPIALIGLGELGAAAAWTWPQHAPSAGAWASAAALALACTAIAYPLFFGLIHRAGQARAATVTLLIPLFALAWGALFLGERIQPDWLLGGVLILGGTALALRRQPASAGVRM